jgi:outer membrane protein assembly factor BamB/tetratricopeptide (TPR) repeat protein
MSWSTRRATLVLSLTAMLLAASALQHAVAQKLPPLPAPGAAPVEAKKDVYDFGGLVLPRDEGDRLSDLMNAALDYIKKKEWDRAVKDLQQLVDRTDDIQVPVVRKDHENREVTSYVSARQEAARIIGKLPKEGRDFYQLTFGGGDTTKLVDDAVASNDVVGMAHVVNRFLYTEQGGKAADWLGTYYLDRGDYSGAIRYFSLLGVRNGLKGLSDNQLLKSYLAYHLGGDLVARDEIFREMDRRGHDFQLVSGRPDQRLSVADIRDSVTKLVTAAVGQNASDLPIYRGSGNRTATQLGGTAFLEHLWVAKMLSPTSTTTSRDWLIPAEKKLEQKNIPNLPTFHPVTATVVKGEKKIPLILYRSFLGIHAVNLRSGKLEWESPSDWSLERVFDKDSDGPKIQAYRDWLTFFVTNNARPQIVFDNSVLGTLSCDSRFAYAIEDLAVPPPAQMFPPGGAPGMAPGINHGVKVAEAVNSNKLQAFSLSRSGAFIWERGGPEEKAELADTYFLGPPLPINDRLYVLTEKQQEIRLVCLDPNAKGKVLSSQLLANVKNIKLSQDPLRRTQACQLAYAEGILIVPTNAGAVFGVDVLTGSLVWACPYRSSTEAKAPEAPPGGVPPGVIIRPGRGFPMVNNTNLDSHWRVTAPMIQEGKVVFTAPDDKAIHCINLRDGMRMWQQTGRPDDLFLAGVFNGKVVVVGKTKTRALSLSNGTLLWELDTGLPSGEGAPSALKPGEASDVIYYLPVAKSVSTGDPEIVAINVDKGLIHAHTRSRKNEKPGNLLFYEGTMISQSASEVVAYPQLEVKLRQLDEIVRDKPNDPDALTERGDYLLDKGELPRATADFRKALAQADIKPETRTKARDKLYDALTEMLQKDFESAEAHLKEYEDLCKIDVAGLAGAALTARKTEERRRRANFLCLVGKGREKQKRLVEAFEKYLELGEEAKKDELIQVVDEPSVKAAPDVWSQGRIAAMVAKADDAAQKAALEAKIKERWDKLAATKEPALDDLRKFVQMFGSLFDVGKEARLALAERLMEDPDLNSLLEAEQQLTLLRGDDEKPEVAARALEALGRLNTRKGLMEDAAYYYRLLGQKYPKVMVIDGKTGGKLWEDAQSWKPLLPYIDLPGSFHLTSKGDIKGKETATTPAFSPAYDFAQDGEPLPFFTRGKLALRYDTHSLLLPARPGEKPEEIKLTNTQFQQIATLNHQPQAAPQMLRFSYQNQGHLVVLQLGNMVFGIDPLGKGRVLWERNLLEVPAAGVMAIQPLDVDARDNGVLIAYPDGWIQRVGQAGPLQGGVICLQKRHSIEAIDPVSGRILWTRSDVNSPTQVFGDDKYVYIVNLDNKSNAVGTRVVRAYDGVSVSVRDFSQAFDKRVRMVGRNILTSEVAPKTQELDVRLYDVLEGKDLWSKKFPAGAVMTKSVDDRLVGVIEATGEVHVFDLPTQQEVMTGKLDDPKHIEKAQAVYLLADSDSIYLAVNGPADPNVVPWSGVQSTLQPGTGLRAVPVNGALYSFNRATGKRSWIACDHERDHVGDHVRNQMLVLNHFDEMPIVLLTSRYTEWQGGPAARTQMNKSVCQAFIKRNGKQCYKNDALPPGLAFYDLSIDSRAGKVELLGTQLKVTFSVVE